MHECKKYNCQVKFIYGFMVSWPIIVELRGLWLLNQLLY